MKIVMRILVILVVMGLIGEAAGLIIKTVDSGAAAPAKPAGSSANGGQALNREQPSQGGSGSSQKSGSSAFSLNVTLENLGKMALVVTGVWGIERSAKNRRRVTPSPVAVRRSQPRRLAMPASRERFLPRPALDLIRRADG